jgi:hypothetical protein
LENLENKNSAKGRDSYDVDIGGTIVPFFNRNVTPYPTEVGGPNFDLVPIEKQKDIMLNNARHFAQQEYNRIMELVSVLQKQANDIKRRLEITDAVHAAEYQFQLSVGKCYWLVWDNRKQKTILTHHGPEDWSTGKPENYDYMTQVRFMGDLTWEEIK